MSRRRPDDLDDDALDLLLDAISNVFGGILFIALAVVILLQFTVPEPPSPTPTETTQADTAANPEFSEALLAALDSDASRQDSDASVRRSRLVEAIARETEAVRNAQDRRDAQEQAAAAAAEQARTADARQSQLQSQLLEAQRTLDALRNRPTQRVRAARFRPSAKQEIPLMVAAGHVLRPVAADGSVRRDALRMDPQQQTARPAARAGTPISPGAAGDAELTRLLAPLDPARHYLNAAVWPDGFDAARRLRDAAIDLGFDFTLTPVPAGRGVPFNAASGVQ
ncbi:MAG: hypothetical protein AAGE65_08935 [Planctomycetota bacterium]